MPQRPASATTFTINFGALLAGLAALFVLQQHWPDNTLRNSVSACAVIAALIGFHDLFIARVWQRETAGLVTLVPRRAAAPRVGVKLIGLLASLALPALCYLLFPEYRGSFYAPWWAALETVGGAMLALAPAYFWWMDGLQREPHDSYWHLGAVLLRLETPDWPRIAQHYGGWVVKGFFLPLMVAYMVSQVAATTRHFHQLTPANGLSFYDFAYALVFMVDVMFAVIGYALALRVTDSHIRSTEPTGLGWMVALVCYEPFWSVIGTQYLAYEAHSVNWGPWLNGHAVIQALWGGAIIALITVYSLSTVAFGLRFSNLTHRGILTGGPYRFTKHPAYLAKNLSWWLIAVPFVSNAGAWEALRGCALLALLNGIYGLRALTEERHLARDPVYREYQAWIAAHGILAQARRWARRCLSRAGTR